MAATKYVGPAEARQLVAAGCVDLGESRPQELWEKAAALADPAVRWHMIGTLQRNKARKTLPLVCLIHSVDSVPLLETLDRLAAELGRPAAVLLEVNVSGEASKHGFAPGQLPPLVEQLPRYGHVEVRGLMCMAGLGGGPDRAPCEAGSRRDFARLRQLRDCLAAGSHRGRRPDRAFHGNERRLRGRDRGRGDAGPRRLGPVRGDRGVIAIEPHPEGAILPVRAHPGARRNAIRGPQQDALRVDVAQSPEKGKANKAILAVLCDGLALRKSQIELLSGATSAQKRFLVRGLSPQELARRIELLP